MDIIFSHAGLQITFGRKHFIVSNACPVYCGISYVTEERRFNFASNSPLHILFYVIFQVLCKLLLVGFSNFLTHGGQTFGMMRRDTW